MLDELLLDRYHCGDHGLGLWQAMLDSVAVYRLLIGR